MNDKEMPGFTLLGLHGLAAPNGDGLVPELLALLTERAHAETTGGPSAAVVAFPARVPRPPVSGSGAPDGGRNDNIVAFPPSGRRRCGRESA